jgi:predicted MFS family arabinose efflux permease
VCGFHASFLAAHMPSALRGYGLEANFAAIWLGVLGLANALGALGSGAAVQRFGCKLVLASLYALVAIAVAVFVAAPKSQPVLLGFAGAMGLACMATVAPTAGLIVRLYGPRHVGTLVGVLMLVHQTGGFLGVWLGGLALERCGDYGLIWRIDILAALAAVALTLAVREPRVRTLTPDPRRTRPASVPADRSEPAMPVWRVARSVPESSRRRAAPSAVGGSG